MLLKRAFGVGMVLGLAFILLVSLVVSAVLSAFGDQLGRFLPSGLSAPVLEAINFVGSLAVISLLFGAIFKVLPDAKISWRDVRVGASVRRCSRPPARTCGQRAMPTPRSCGSDRWGSTPRPRVRPSRSPTSPSRAIRE